jgi:hypothetical protein
MYRILGFPQSPGLCIRSESPHFYALVTDGREGDNAVPMPLPRLLYSSWLRFVSGGGEPHRDGDRVLKRLDRILYSTKGNGGSDALTSQLLQLPFASSHHLFILLLPHLMR